MPPRIKETSSRSDLVGLAREEEESGPQYTTKLAGPSEKKIGGVPSYSAKEPAPFAGMYNTGFLGDHHKEKPLWKRLNYLHISILFGTPLIAIYGLATTPIVAKTLIWAITYYFLTALGITAGYHRMYAHKAYDAAPLTKVVLAFLGTGAVQGSVRWWSRDHRAHHRYVDTSKDPYAVTKGFWYAHIGWMLSKQDPTKIGRVPNDELKDLYEDKFVAWQHKWYLPLAIFWGVLFPSLVAGLGWNDWRGGYFIAGVLRLVAVHHSTFAINSVAHYLGDAVHSDRHTARNSFITAVLTNGEGLHNFHHEFPADYRNGYRWYHYDPTKWFIAGLSALGLAYNLKRFPLNEIEKGTVQMEQKKLNEKAAALNWGPAVESLPTYTMTEIKQKVANEGMYWLVIDGFVVDVETFMDDHPGGVKYLKFYLGKDCTEAFKGETYKHSQAARNLQETMRVGRVAVAAAAEEVVAATKQE